MGLRGIIDIHWGYIIRGFSIYNIRYVVENIAQRAQGVRKIITREKLPVDISVEMW